MLGSIGSILSGLFGNSGSTSESFNQNTNSTTNASSQDLSPELLKTLEGLFQSQVGGTSFGDSTSAIGGRLADAVKASKAPQFDVAGFAKGITDQAASSAGLDLESSINNMLSQSNITEGGNSMGALLANKLRNATAANLGGISADATAKGEQIRESQQGQITGDINTLGGTLLSSITDLIKSVRGADTTGTSNTKSTTTGTAKSKTSGGILGALFG